MLLPRVGSAAAGSSKILAVRDGEQQAQNKALILAIVFASVLVLLLVGYLILRHCRRTHLEAPRFLPEAVKRRWRMWSPGTYTSPASTPRLGSARGARNRRTQRRAAAQSSAGVDRVNSVRSIMTLPEYRPVAAADRERTIGREGERGGIDVVVELPETEVEEEERREEHMQRLYEIRLARRLEQATERESRDLSAVQDSSRPTSQNSNRGNLIEEGERRPRSASALMATLADLQERERRLSSVSYASVGLAKPDGSRVRPSMDSVDSPLLDSGAPMGVGGRGHMRSNSGLSMASSIGPPDRRGSDEIFNLGSARASMDTRAGIEGSHSMPGTPGLSGVHHASWGETPGHYEGEGWNEPPPAYTSPVETRNHGPDSLPMLRIETISPPRSHSTSPVGR